MINFKKSLFIGLIAVILISFALVAIWQIKRNQFVDLSDHLGNDFKKIEQQAIAESIRQGMVKPIDSTDHIWGDLSAPVQFIIYNDFECQFCADFFKTIEQLKQEYDNQVVVAFRHYPLSFHANAKPAASASECAAEQGKFWEMYRLLFADNKSGKFYPEQFVLNASSIGLDMVKFRQCFEQDKYQDKIIDSILEAKSFGVSGAPANFINDIPYPGAYPLDDFIDSQGLSRKGLRTIINEIIKK